MCNSLPLRLPRESASDENRIDMRRIPVFDYGGGAAAICWRTQQKHGQDARARRRESYRLLNCNIEEPNAVEIENYAPDFSRGTSIQPLTGSRWRGRKSLEAETQDVRRRAPTSILTRTRWTERLCWKAFRGPCS